MLQLTYSNIKDVTFVKALGILGAHKEHGVTRMMLDQVLHQVQAPNTSEIIYLEDYQIKPDIKGQPNPTMDQIIAKLEAADVWVIAAPTYWGGLSGVMKNFFDCLRQRLVRFDHKGGTHPDKFAHKHYISLTNCYAGKWENFLSGVTDASFRTIDKVLTAGGLIKIGEAVQTATWGLTELAPAKQKELTKLGQKINRATRKDDQTVKRYFELFFIVAVMAFITMAIQSLCLKLLNLSLGFWSNYISFVIIFFALLAVTLHFFTVVKHKRK